MWAHEEAQVSYKVNCAFKKYNPGVPRIFMTGRDTTLPIYMFLATDHVIQHLSAKIDGINNNADVVDVGMIHGTPKLKIYNVTFSVKMDKINFWISRRVH